MTTLAVVAHREKLVPEKRAVLRAALAAADLGGARWIDIDKGSDAAKAARKALDKGADTVLVCGGDGTVRGVAEALARSGAALAVMPVGTANLFAGAFDMSDDPEQVVGTIVGGRREIIDTGRCGDLGFNVMGGVGFDAGMIDAADDDKERLGMIAYLRAGAREAREREPFAVKVKVDGDVFFDGEATCVLVGNIGRLKGGIEAFPDGSATDGLLDVAVVTAAGMREWAGLMVAALRHRQQLTGHAELGQGSSITVRLAKQHRFELDGGTKGRTKRLDFEVLPASLVVCTS